MGIYNFGNVNEVLFKADKDARLSDGEKMLLETLVTLADTAHSPIKQIFKRQTLYESFEIEIMLYHLAQYGYIKMKEDDIIICRIK
jgi:hypothetical protein